MLDLLLMYTSSRCGAASHCSCSNAAAGFARWSPLAAAEWAVAAEFTASRLASPINVNDLIV